MRYHITENGPARCIAKKRACPIGGEHFESLKEAQGVYEKTMNSIPNRMNKSFRMDVSMETRKIVSILNDNGIQALIVGGSVRDKFLGIDNKDIDLELYGEKNNGESLEFNDIKKLFKRNEGYKIDEAGASFSVLKVRSGGEDFDIALPRTEKSTGDKHTDYDVQHDSRLSFEEAASRRDFTINSMGYDINTNRLIDPYGGENDLKNKELKHISEAFSDDPLRCMRAVNFASRFNFTVNDETQKLCRDLASTYPTLAHERVEEEFNKLFNKGDYCDRGLETLHDIGWSKQMPPFADCTREELSSYGKKLNGVKKGLNRKIMLTTLMEQDGHRNNVAQFIESSSRGRTIIHGGNALLNNIKNGDHASIVLSHRKLKSCHNITNDEIKQMCDSAGIDSTPFKNIPETPTQAVVTGKKLIEMGYSPGPDMGKIINKAQYIQDSEDIYDFDELLKRAL